jgi:hypothetical protein
MLMIEIRDGELLDTIERTVKERASAARRS